MRYFISLLAIIIFFSSCSDNSGSSTLNVFRATEEGLQQSVKTISQSNEVIYHSLEDRLADPKSSNYAIIWQPKALVVKSLSDTIITYIRQLKEELKDEAGFSNPLDRTSFKEDKIPTVYHFFNEHDKGKELFNHLMKYRQDILAVDTQLNNAFKNNIVVFARGFDHTRNDTGVFTKSFFNDIPVIAACAMLSKLENNIRIIENNFILFCHNKIGCLHCGGYEIVLPVVMQSSGYVKGGEIIEITAGIGVFTGMPNPKITVNGKSIPTEYGLTSYKLKTSLKAGEHSVPVKIEFIKPDGTSDFYTKNIEYTVIEEKQ